MSDIQRIINVIDWLIFNKIVKNRRDLAERLGYTESSLSQIINEKVSLSDKFINKLSEFHKEINIDWIKTGEGQMLKQETSNNMDEKEKLGILEEAIQIMKQELEDKQHIIESLTESNRELISFITGSHGIKKKEAI